MTRDVPCREVALSRADLRRFNAVLQRGVGLRAVAGATVQAFLTEGLGIDPEYVRQRITTVFMDGRVVDALEEAVLHDGSLLALSAAMPGLVGATLRRGGYYAAMRASISAAAERSAPAPSPDVIRVRVKLFNLLIEELGPVLLAHGVAIAADDARQALGDGSPPVPAGAEEVWLRAVLR
jgi:hypothetical protein